MNCQAKSTKASSERKAVVTTRAITIAIHATSTPPKSAQILREDVPHHVHRCAHRRSRTIATKISRRVIGKASTQVAANPGVALELVVPEEWRVSTGRTTRPARWTPTQ